MPTSKLKIRYVLELIVAMIASFVFVIAVSDTQVFDPEALQGLVAIFFAVIGARHMIALGRSGWWGIFAITGIGALVILLMPPKRDFKYNVSLK
jgi:hypothetical protein